MQYANALAARHRSAACHPLRVLTVVALPIALMSLGGCASLDATADVTEASTLVAYRTGLATPWAEPWDEASVAWDGVAPLSPGAAVSVALQNNHLIRGEVESIVASRADVVQAHLLPNPVLNVAVGFPTDGMGGTPLAISLVQQLSWLWRRPVAIDAAEARLRQRILDVSDAAIELVADVRRAHADLVFAERALVVQRETMAILERSVTLMQAQHAAGAVTRLDVNRSELALETGMTKLVERGAAREQAQHRLLALLGRADAGLGWRTNDHVPDVGEALAMTEDEIVEQAVTHRLDVAAAAAQHDARVADLELATLGRLPDIGAGVGYQKNFSDRPGVFPSATVTPKLFDDNSARIARAASELEQSRIAADRVRQQAISEARGAWVALHEAGRVVRAYEDRIVTLADRNRVIAQVSFDVGEVDVNVLLEAERVSSAARLTLTDRRRDATSRLIELERAAGGALIASKREESS